MVQKYGPWLPRIYVIVTLRVRGKSIRFRVAIWQPKNISKAFSVYPFTALFGVSQLVKWRSYVALPEAKVENLLPYQWIEFS